MADRSGDWLDQALRDLDHATGSQAAGHHEWACFAAHQAAEKAVKALHLSRGQQVIGHVIRELIEHLPGSVSVPSGLPDRARTLDAYYIPARYPNGHPSGAPKDPWGSTSGWSSRRSSGAGRRAGSPAPNLARALPRSDRAATWRPSSSCRHQPMRTTRRSS